MCKYDKKFQKTKMTNDIFPIDAVARFKKVPKNWNFVID